MNNTLHKEFTKNNKIICCFGELLLRFSPQMDGVFIRQATMPVFIGGAELNVSAALARWNLPVKYITALPDNYLSKEIIDSIDKKDIDTSAIQFCGERIGIYYLPQGADMKNNAVIYDRDHSSFASLMPGEINWDKIFENVSWFHLSAISPALNEGTAAVCLEAVKAAASKDITISIDLNYRAKLWKYGKEPAKVMPEIVQYCNVIMGNVWSAEKLLGIELEEGFSHDGATKETYLHQSMLTAGKIQQKFTNCKAVANTFRFDEGQGIRYFATLRMGDDDFHSATYSTLKIIDKVGSGDCFMGGLIYGLYNYNQPEDIIEYAAAAAFGKLQETGDTTFNSIEEIQKIIVANG